jgi:hypothetical protein
LATADVSASDPIRGQIVALLASGKYESAFTLAVTTAGSGDNGAAVFCCSRATQCGRGDDTRAVASTLSQPILLCLMQQLGTSLLAPADAKPDVALEVAWLLEIALNLDPTSGQIRAHVPGVVRQLLTGINSRMERDDPRLRDPLRRLLQVVRGMQVG